MELDHLALRVKRQERRREHLGDRTDLELGRRRRPPATAARHFPIGVETLRAAIIAADRDPRAGAALDQRTRSRCHRRIDFRVCRLLCLSHAQPCSRCDRDQDHAHTQRQSSHHVHLHECAPARDILTARTVKPRFLRKPDCVQRVGRIGPADPHYYDTYIAYRHAHPRADSPGDLSGAVMQSASQHDPTKKRY